MIKYGSDTVTELRFVRMTSRVEERGQWIDIYIKPETAEETPVPDEFEQLEAFIICNQSWDIIQYVVLDAGCDSEFTFTEDEKEQLAQYVKSLQR